MQTRKTGIKGWTHTHTGYYERPDGQLFTFQLYKLGAAGYRAQDTHGKPFVFLDGSLNPLHPDVGAGERLTLSIERARPPFRRSQRDQWWHERALLRASGEHDSELERFQENTMDRVKALPRPRVYRRFAARWESATCPGAEYLHAGPPYRTVELEMSPFDQGDPFTETRPTYRAGALTVEIQVRKQGRGPWLPVLL